MEYAIVFLIIYAYLAFSFQTIAKNSGTENAIHAWIPVLNLILIARISQKPDWVGILMLIPVVNFVVGIYLMIEIIKIMHKPAWLGILLMVPGLGLIVPGIVAFSKGTAPVSKNIGNLIISMVVSSFFIAVIAYIILTYVPINNLAKSNEAFSPDKIKGLEKKFKTTPKTIVIENLRTYHENIRKERAKIVAILNQFDVPNEMRFPGMQARESEKSFSITNFKTKMNVYVAALKSYYQSFMHKPADTDEDSFSPSAVKYVKEPFDVLKQKLDSTEDCRLALKKFLIITELVNSMNTSINKLKELAEDENATPELARFKSQKPVCAIVSLKFPEFKLGTIEKLRDEKSMAGIDSTRIYATLPFSLEIVLEPELYSLFYRNIATPKELNIQHNKLQATITEDEDENDRLTKEMALVESLFNIDEESTKLEIADTAVRMKYGIRYDFLSATMKITEMVEKIETHLLSDKQTRALYIKHFPEMIGKELAKPLPPKGKDAKDHKGRWENCYKVQEKLSKLIAENQLFRPSYYVTKINGAAIDFTLDSFIDRIMYEQKVVSGVLEPTNQEE
ncbi:MAG: DUF5684 domain-containing protein [Planctomycetes bacterium]|nr:DUF5684 domain-containing protein [Planctomycetota bacterium]